jgi:hypothetical protein
MREIHWDKATGKATLAKPLGKGYWINNIIAV